MYSSSFLRTISLVFYAFRFECGRQLELSRLKAALLRLSGLVYTLATAGTYLCNTNTITNIRNRIRIISIRIGINSRVICHAFQSPLKNASFCSNTREYKHYFARTIFWNFKLVYKLTNENTTNTTKIKHSLEMAGLNSKYKIDKRHLAEFGRCKCKLSTKMTNGRNEGNTLFHIHNMLKCTRHTTRSIGRQSFVDDTKHQLF